MKSLVAVVAGAVMTFGAVAVGSAKSHPPTRKAPRVVAPKKTIQKKELKLLLDALDRVKIERIAFEKILP
jgi:hypothetical protein